MALYDKASLVLIPSGTKEGVLFSQKPTNGDGDFTFSRSTSATRVGPSGYIEKETQNLLLQSNTFDTTWVASNGATISSGEAGYDGTNDAWLLTKSTNNFSNINQSVSASGVNTYSVYAKGTSTNFSLRDNVSGTRLEVNLNDGSIVLQQSGIIVANVQDVGGGWYRVSATFNETLSVVQIYPKFNSADVVSVTIQDAQLEQGLVARDYIETTTSAVYGGITDNIPRLDYTDSSCPSLKLEPQRSNLITQSEFTGGYIKSNVTATSNQAISPDGLNNATEIETTDTGQCHMRTTFTAATGNYVGSVFVKKQDFDYIYMEMGGAYAWFNIDSGALGNGNNYGSDWTYVDHSIEDYGNGWYRCILVGNCLTAGSYSFRSIQPVPSNGLYNSGLSGGITYWYGAQLEQGSYATSYIPTYGTSVTRNADTASKTGVSDLIGQTEGTLFLDFKLPKISTPQNHTWVALKDSPQNNRILIYFLANSETLRAQIKASGTADNLNLGTISDGDRVKIAIAYKSGDSVVYVNGLSASTSTSALSFGTMDIIDFNDSSAPFEGNAKQIMLFKTRLSNDELAALTTI